MFNLIITQGGASVTISDRNQEKGEATLSELKEIFGSNRVQFVACDVTSDDDLDTLFAETEKFFKVIMKFIFVFYYLTLISFFVP